MTTHGERIKLTAERFATLKRQLHEAGTDRTEAIREALAAGMTHREVARHTGLSRQRVTQLGDPRPADPRPAYEPLATGARETCSYPCGNPEHDHYPTRGSHYRAT